MSALLFARPLAPLLAIALLAATLPGQTVAGRALIGAPRSSVSLPGQTERGSGLWAGVAFDVHAGRVAVSASGTRGYLTASQAGSVPERDVGEVSLGGHYEVRPWVHLAGRYTARAFSSAAGYQRWDVLSVGACLSRHLGTPTVRAFASIEYLPVVGLSGQPRPDFGIASDVGITLAPGFVPITGMLRYRIERFRFPQATGRSEQFEVLTLSVGVRARLFASSSTVE